MSGGFPITKPSQSQHYSLSLDMMAPPRTKVRRRKTGMMIQKPKAEEDTSLPLPPLKQKKKKEPEEDENWTPTYSTRTRSAIVNIKEERIDETTKSTVSENTRSRTLRSAFRKPKKAIVDDEVGAEDEDEDVVIVENDVPFSDIASSLKSPTLQNQKNKTEPPKEPLPLSDDDSVTDSLINSRTQDWINKQNPKLSPEKTATESEDPPEKVTPKFDSSWRSSEIHEVIHNLKKKHYERKRSQNADTGECEFLQEGSSIQPDSAVHKLQIDGAKRNLMNDRVFSSDIVTEDERKKRRKPIIRKVRSDFAGIERVKRNILNDKNFSDSPEEGNPEISEKTTDEIEPEPFSESLREADKSLPTAKRRKPKIITPQFLENKVGEAEKPVDAQDPAVEKKLKRRSRRAVKHVTRIRASFNQGLEQTTVQEPHDETKKDILTWISKLGWARNWCDDVIQVLEGMKTTLKNFEPLELDTTDSETEDCQTEVLENSDLGNMMDDFDSFLQT